MNVWLSSFVFTKELSRFFSGESKRDPIVRGDERSAKVYPPQILYYYSKN